MGQAWWFTPVIPALWEDEVGRSPEVRNSIQPDQHGKILCVLIIQKLAGHGDTVVPAAWEAEAGELLEPGRWRLR